MIGKRLKKELKDFKEEGFEGGPDSLDDLKHWHVTLPGPRDSPYSKAQFKLEIVFPDDYPFSPPQMKFLSKVFHPNISAETGNICLDILKSEWSPVLQITKVLISLQSLLDDPNPQSPLNGTAARLYLYDRKKYDETVETWIQQYAQ